MPRLNIYLLCHDRPQDARRAILSIQAQTDREFSFTVSDNSSNDELEQIVRAEFPHVRYVRRHPMLPALEHFNRCIDEADGEYFCLFHDDDLMLPGFVAGMRHAIARYPDAIALGCNARIESFGTLQAQPSFRAIQPYEIITSPHALASRYFARSQSGIAPFPGYVYQRQGVGDLRGRNDGGKYSDVTWLLRLLAHGPIVWIRAPLMTYRIHGGNDGVIESRRDRLRLLAYLKRHRETIGLDILQDYRCAFIYKTITRAPEASPPHRFRIAQDFVRRYRWQRYLRPQSYTAAFKRAWVKWMDRA